MAEIPGNPDALPLRTLRYRARLGAVQGLYRMDIAGDQLEDVIEDFLDHHLGHHPGGGGPDALGEADDTHFGFLMRGVADRQVEVDRAIESQLAEGWTLPRLDTTVRAILRAGVFELMAAGSVPPRVIIDEYVSIADSFFDDAEVRFINGVLDALARRLRPKDMHGTQD